MDLVGRSLSYYAITDPLEQEERATVYRSYPPATERYGVKDSSTQQISIPSLQARCARRRRAVARFNHSRMMQSLRNTQGAHEGELAWL